MIADALLASESAPDWQAASPCSAHNDAASTDRLRARLNMEDQS